MSATAGPLVLLVSHGGVIVGRHPLEGPGPFSIGRSRSNHIVIDHSSISRRHAALMLRPLAIVDCGSSNGTWLRGRRLAPDELVELGPNESASLGEMTILLQRTARARRSPAPTRPPGATERAQLRDPAHRPAPGSCLRVHVLAAADRERVAELLAEALPGGSLMGEPHPGRFEALLFDAEGAEARATLERVRLSCAAAQVAVGLGLGCYPFDGTSPEELSALAWERASAPLDGAPTAMDRVRELVAQVAPSTLSVLVRGETGTGKELCVELLHRLSPRAHRPLVHINCAAFPEALLESELFGHVKGAFTGAHVAKVGLIETADGGTVFLDEIGELSPGMQSKLLRVLESRELRRVGGVETRPIDVRFVAATHRALADDIEAGRFRQDLFFRLSGVTVALPPLRQRRESIEGLARAFVTGGVRTGRPPLDFTPAALTCLEEWRWPGNVRELRHAIERAVLFAGAGPIDVQHLGFESDMSDPGTLPGLRVRVPERPGTRAGAVPATAPTPVVPPPSLHDEVARLEHARILQALADCGGNQTRAARALGISRGTLQTRMDAFGIVRPRKA